MTTSQQDNSNIVYDNRFGWSFEKRVSELEAQLQKAKSTANGPTHPVKMKGERKYLPIIRVPIELPKYRLANGRTRNSQKEYLANNSALSEDLFTYDEEMVDAQIAQHEILLLHADEADLRKYFSDSKHVQEQPLLLTHDGFVLNGNRRLSVWREHYYTDAKEYEHLRYVQVVWLEELQSDELKRLERELQIQRGLKSDYLWHARAQMVEDARIDSNLNNSEIATEFDLEKAGDVDELIGMLQLAREYLESRDKHDKWSTLNKSEWGFRALYQHLRSLTDTTGRDVLRGLTFTLIDGADTSTRGSIWNTVRAIKDALPEIKQRLIEDHVVSHQETGERDEAPSNTQNDSEWDDIFGSEESPDLANPGLEELLNDESKRQQVLESAQDELQAHASREREKKDANYLIKMAGQANSSLLNVKNSMSTDRNLDGLEDQLGQLEVTIESIREWMKSNAPN